MIRNIKFHIGTFLCSILITLLLSFLSGCAGGNFGSLRLSSEVDNLFQSHQVLDNHNYYYSGSDAIPNGIIGVHKDYTLQSGLWKPVDLTPDQLKQWVFLMTNHKGTSIRIYGSRIFGPDGTAIGVWYSPYDQTVVKMLENHDVVIHTPNAEPLDKRKRMGLFLDND